MTESASNLLDALNVFKQLKRAKDESENPPQFISTACRILHGSVVVTVMFILCMSIPIASICIGTAYLDKCPIQNYIPIWLIVNGSFGLLTLAIRILVNFYSMIRGIRENKTLRFNPFTRMSLLIEVFLFAWFICGNVWVYSIKNTVVHNDTESPLFCHQVVYSYAFWTITLTYIFVPMIIGVCIWLIAATALGYFSCLFSTNSSA